MVASAREDIRASLAVRSQERALKQVYQYSLELVGQQSHGGRVPMEHQRDWRRKVVGCTTLDCGLKTVMWDRYIRDGRKRPIHPSTPTSSPSARWSESILTRSR